MFQTLEVFFGKEQPFYETVSTLELFKHRQESLVVGKQNEGYDNNDCGDNDDWL